MTNFEGIVPNLERRYRETDSDWSREKIEEYMTLRPCPDVQGRAAAARVAGRAGGRARASTSSRGMSRAGARSSGSRASSSPTPSARSPG